MGGEQLKMQQQFRITAAGFRNPSDLDLIVSLSHEITVYPLVEYLTNNLKTGVQDITKYCSSSGIL
jgi:hypothetical protein